MRFSSGSFEGSLPVGFELVERVDRTRDVLITESTGVGARDAGRIHLHDRARQMLDGFEAVAEHASQPMLAREHEVLLEEIESGDPDRAEAEAVRHLESARDLVTTYLSRT
jgi:DNA-binding FadR family transcriptional regulator